jgi:hypothetical protein
VSLTPANTCFTGVNDTGDNFLQVSLTLVKISKTAKVSLTSVIDIGKELLTGVNDTGNACFASVVDAGEAPK